MLQCMRITNVTDAHDDAYDKKACEIPCLAQLLIGDSVLLEITANTYTNRD